MKLSEEESKKYYTEVAKSLIEDGITGWSVEDLAQSLMDDPDNPFQPLSAEEIRQKLEESEKDIREGRVRPFKEAIEEMRQKYKIKRRKKEES